jgi:DNA-binding HxlR family transcriptional regulator
VRSYRQYCAAAKTLDVVGDRWSLLIVRELLLRGPSRYSDLQAGLPGIATNLLADRLRELETKGVLERVEAPPPIATTLFQLTERGRELEDVIDALIRWGVPLMAEPSHNDHFRSRWISYPAELFLSDNAPGEPPVAIEVRTGDEPMTIETSDGAVHARPGRTAETPDVVLAGPAQPVLGLLIGYLTVAEARTAGVEVTGDERVLRRLRPLRPPHPAMAR